MDRPAAWRESAVDLETERPFRLGGATVDPVSREGAFEGGCERLQPQTLKVLVALVRRKGKVVTRSELIDSCWGGRIVGEDVINRSISLLRNFAERAGGFSIETIPKSGYRLVETGARPPWTGWSRLTASGAILAAATALILLLRVPAPWSSAPAPTREMQVQLAGFTALSDDIAPALLQSLQDETLAAFADDGAIGVTTTPAPDTRDAPAYQMRGSVARDGSSYKVVLRIDNSMTGASLWSRAFEHRGEAPSEVARLAALDLATMARCGFGRSITYRRPMPDESLRLIFLACENDGTISWQLDRALDYTRRITIASPDFSAGWSGIAGIGVVLRTQVPPSEARRIEIEARRALDTALRIDPMNSEAWALRAYYLPPDRFAEREKSLRRAIEARPLDCGCEHFAYGLFLSEVGRLKEAVREFQRGVDIMHLNAGLYANLARAQFALGDEKAALATLDLARRVSRDRSDLDLIAAQFAIASGDHKRALDILGSPALAGIPDADLLARTASALRTRDPAAIGGARGVLTRLSSDPRTNGALVATQLAMLGDTDGAFQALKRLAATNPAAAHRALFDPALGGAVRNPEFWAMAGRLGLEAYWRESGRLPDVCASNDAPGPCASLH